MTEIERDFVMPGQQIIPGLETQSRGYDTAELLALLITHGLVKALISLADSADSENQRQHYVNLAFKSVETYESAFDRSI